MKFLSTALAIGCLSGCAGTFEAARDPATGEASPMLGGAKGVVGGRTVAGVEFPPSILPIGFGVGFWIVRPPAPALSEEDILARERTILIDALGGK